MRFVMLALGFISLGLGLIGVILPLLPTVPFILLSAFCFARSSDRLHNWLLDHRAFGPLIRDWRENGAIPPRVKAIATVSIAGAFAVPAVLGVKPWVMGVQLVVLGLVLVFIWTRPDR